MRSLIPWRDKSDLPAKSENFYDPFMNFRREVDRMFDDFFNDVGTRGMEAWRASPFGLSPVIDVEDTGQEVVVKAELPGLDEKDFEVTLAGDTLTISGEKKSNDENRSGGSYHVERRFGAFSRSVRLPFEASDDKVEASYDRGLLTIRVPKPQEAQRTVKRIDVKHA